MAVAERLTPETPPTARPGVLKPPAGVKLVCVDINPAVVTKLADRGSVESVGIVTDVGLFLRLLAGRLGLV